MIKTFADFLRKYNFNNNQFGDRIGVGRQTVLNWKKGHNVPNPTTLPKIQEVIDSYGEEVLAQDLFDYTGKDTRGRKIKKTKKDLTDNPK